MNPIVVAMAIGFFVIAWFLFNISASIVTSTMYLASIEKLLNKKDFGASSIENIGEYIGRIEKVIRTEISPGPEKRDAVNLGFRREILEALRELERTIRTLQR